MEKQDQAFAIAIVALVVAIVIGGIVFMTPKQESIAGISYDPARQPSVLPMKELTAQSDEAASGIIFDFQKINTTGGTGSPYIGQLVTLTGSTWIKADASTIMNGKLGIVVKAPTTNISSTGQVLVMGVVRNSSWTLTKGTIYYANATTPGTFGAVKSADSAVIQPIGYAYNTTVLYFNPVINATANGI